MSGTFCPLPSPLPHPSQDLQSLWLKECFWHIIFTVLLIVVMILWRPSSNAVRYVYALVHDADEEEEVEQKVNKNLGGCCAVRRQGLL